MSVCCCCMCSRCRCRYRLICHATNARYQHSGQIVHKLRLNGRGRDCRQLCGRAHMLRYGLKAIDKLPRRGGAHCPRPNCCRATAKAKAKGILLQHRSRGRSPHQHRELPARMTCGLDTCTTLQLPMTRLVRIHVHAELQRGCRRRIAAALFALRLQRHLGALRELTAEQHSRRRCGQLKVIFKTATGSASNCCSSSSSSSHRRCFIDWRLQWSQAGQVHETLGVRMCGDQWREGVAVAAKRTLIGGHWRYLRQMLEFSIIATDHAPHSEQIVALVVCAATVCAHATLSGCAGCAGCARRKGEINVRERQLVGG